MFLGEGSEKVKSLKSNDNKNFQYSIILSMDKFEIGRVIADFLLCLGKVSLRNMKPQATLSKKYCFSKLCAT